MLCNTSKLCKLSFLSIGLSLNRGRHLRRQDKVKMELKLMSQRNHHKAKTLDDKRKFIRSDSQQKTKQSLFIPTLKVSINRNEFSRESVLSYMIY